LIKEPECGIPGEEHKALMDENKQHVQKMLDMEMEYMLHQNRMA